MERGSPGRRQLPHGYTNESWCDADRVFKHYTGAGALQRLQAEVGAIQKVAGSVPVPSIVEVVESKLTVVFVRASGVHGQELLDREPEQTLHAVGRTLRQLHEAHPGLVHGDYGPQNLLLHRNTFTVAAVLDWEFSRDGGPVEDLAWAEWIVRMHHPPAVRRLGALFEGYGHEPAWPARHAAMEQRCSELLEQCASSGDPAGRQLWEERRRLTEEWVA